MWLTTPTPHLRGLGFVPQLLIPASCKGSFLEAAGDGSRVRILPHTWETQVWSPGSWWASGNWTNWWEFCLSLSFALSPPLPLLFKDSMTVSVSSRWALIARYVKLGDTGVSRGKRSQEENHEVGMFWGLQYVSTVLVNIWAWCQNIVLSDQPLWGAAPQP